MMRVLDVARRLATVAVVLAVTSPALAGGTATDQPAATGNAAGAKAPATTDAAAKDKTATSTSKKKKARRDPGINQPGAAGNRGVTPGPAGNVGPGR